MEDLSVKQVALYHYDILVYLFDIFESRWRGAGRRTLASCALVCRAWFGPASQVLWRVLDSLHPLWALLAGLNFPPSAKGLTEFWEIVDPEEFVKKIATSEPEQWRRFLHCASHVREIGVASCGEGELSLIRAIVQYNSGKTFLPTLHTLAWRYAFPSDTSLLHIISPSLRSLELSTTRARQFSPFGYATAPAPDNDYTQSEPLFVGLPSAAPHLSRLFISSRHLPGLIVLPHLLRFSHMRELYLFSNLCSLTPLDLHRLFEAMPILELLSTHIRDFDSPDHVASSATLRELRVNGAGRDLAGLLRHGLQAPYLHSLLVTIDEDVWTPSQEHCIKALSDRRYVSCLCKLRIATQTYGDEPPIQPSLPFYSTVVHPLSALRGLEALDLGILHTLFRFEEADILAIARAWPRMKSLVLSYIPSDSLPSISALRHFAEHCPELRGLTLTKLNLTGIGDLQDQIPASYASRPPHPLQKLDLRMTWGVTPAVSGEAAQDIARFLDTLFPNVELRERRPDNSRIDTFFVSWKRIETEIRALRNERTMDLVAWREAHTTTQVGTR